MLVRETNARSEFHFTIWLRRSDVRPVGAADAAGYSDYGTAVAHAL
jgi:hypothetical protein